PTPSVFTIDVIPQAQAAMAPMDSAPLPGAKSNMSISASPAPEVPVSEPSDMATPGNDVQAPPSAAPPSAAPPLAPTSPHITIVQPLQHPDHLGDPSAPPQSQHPSRTRRSSLGVHSHSNSSPNIAAGGGTTPHSHSGNTSRPLSSHILTPVRRAM